ncbi:MAG: carboxypeptidase M32 [Phycisphaerales bacterium]
MPETALPAAYVELCTLRHEAATLSSVAALAMWDQETYMPPGAGEARAAQLGLLARLVHERETSPRVGETLAACEADASVKGDPRLAANVREMRRDYDREVKVPAALVEEIARTCSQGQQAWKGARKASDFKAFKPWLAKTVELSRRKAECIGGGSELYDVLLDAYEPGAKASEIERVFTPLRERLSAFIRDVQENGKKPDDAPLKVHAPTAAQHELGQRVLKAMGFDLNAGRLDVTTHPFCEGVAPGDTRLTTRYHESHFTDALYGTMHEGGHGLYEQGLPKSPDLFGTPLSQAAGLGVHESQSRMWENFVGRSRAFWTWCLPIANELFGGALSTFTPETMSRAVNTCRPSLIRVEADEGTYNLHVMLRFELERALIRGDLGVDDVPGAWNERMKSMLGLDVPDDARGCLQDVHWSAGLLGYFPTYTLGNLYAAQLWEKIKTDLPGLEDAFARGEFAPLLAWLREHVHAHGRRYRAAELLERATGKAPDPAPLMRHLESRIRPAYGL